MIRPPKDNLKRKPLWGGVCDRVGMGETDYRLK